MHHGITASSEQKIRMRYKSTDVELTLQIKSFMKYQLDEIVKPKTNTII